MRTPDQIAIDLADALPETAERRDEVIAVGMLATALIAGCEPEERHELIETFCALLRSSIANELN